jgi:hypothetical protein
MTAVKDMLPILGNKLADHTSLTHGLTQKMLGSLFLAVPDKNTNPPTF